MTLTYLKNGETLRLDRTRCRGCGRCIDVCPHEVLSLEDGRAAIRNISSCMECGACMKNCESGAISVRAGVGCAAAVISGMLRGAPAECSRGGPEAPKGGCCG